MNKEIKQIMDVLSTIKISNTLYETQIHQEIKKALLDRGINFRHEYKILTRKRFDFWINGIVLEVKKRKPVKISLLNQLNRYTKVPAVKAIIVVLERSIDLPKSMNEKPIFVKSLNQNWGLAI